MAPLENEEDLTYYYNVLDLAPGATEDDVNRAYDNIVKHYRWEDENDRKILKTFEEARDVLLDHVRHGASGSNERVKNPVSDHGSEKYYECGYESDFNQRSKPDKTYIRKSEGPLDKFLGGTGNYLFAIWTFLIIISLYDKNSQYVSINYFNSLLLFSILISPVKIHMRWNDSEGVIWGVAAGMLLSAILAGIYLYPNIETLWVVYIVNGAWIGAAAPREFTGEEGWRSIVRVVKPMILGYILLVIIALFIFGFAKSTGRALGLKGW